MTDNTVELTPSVRSIARQQNIDLNTLLQILELRRGDQTKTENEFANALLESLKDDGAQMDQFGNVWLVIGDSPNIMWSCHTDTVTKDGGRQNLKWNGDILALNQGKPGQCLGADDGAGLWLLLEMIKVKKPGLYIFHRAEEVGRLGSKFISGKTPDLLKGIEIAIAFDRRGTDSIITHQSGRRSCSDKFADALGTALGTNFKKDPTGSYTDTYSYVDQVAECTNVSVGYQKEHGPLETLDVAHLFRLRAALLAMDASTLPVDRDPTTTEWDDDDRWGGYGSWSGSQWGKETKAIDEIEAMIKYSPRSFARWFYNAKMDADVLECMLGSWVRPKKKAPLLPGLPGSAAESAKVFQANDAAAAYLRDRGVADEDLADEDEQYEELGLYCLDCEQPHEMQGTFEPQDGDPCPVCHSLMTRVEDVLIHSVTGEVVLA